MALQAEGVGFEPTVAYKTTTVFETAPIVHSGTLPRQSTSNWAYSTTISHFDHPLYIDSSAPFD